MNEIISKLMGVPALDRQVIPEHGQSFFEPRALSTMVSSGVSGKIYCNYPDQGTIKPVYFCCSTSTRPKNFLVVCLTPDETSKEIEIDFLSSRTRTTVQSRIKRMIDSAANECVFHASMYPDTRRPWNGHS
jgi:hypothetical protein